MSEETNIPLSFMINIHDLPEKNFQIITDWSKNNVLRYNKSDVGKLGVIKKKVKGKIVKGDYIKKSGDDMVKGTSEDAEGIVVEDVAKGTKEVVCIIYKKE